MDFPQFGRFYFCIARIKITQQSTNNKKNRGFLTYSKYKNRGFLTYSKYKNRGFLTKQTKIFVYIKENQ